MLTRCPALAPVSLCVLGSLSRFNVSTPNGPLPVTEWVTWNAEQKTLRTMSVLSASNDAGARRERTAERPALQLLCAV